MKTILYNLGYFFTEAKKLIRFNPLSNVFTVIGTGLILFLLGLVLAGWTFGAQLIETLQEEAEINAYFSEGLEREEAHTLIDQISTMNGVTNASYIEEAQAKLQMEEMLGEESKILELFDENPFEAYIAVRINLNTMDQVIEEIRGLEGIDYVRDNRSVLVQMKEITDGLKVLGSLIILAVSITTLIILSHMIRQGIYQNREQIKTLRLLGAPNFFIGFPFVLSGTLLTLVGGVLAVVGFVVILQFGYGQLSTSLLFIPLPTKEALQNDISVKLLLISLVLGSAGSMFGLTSIRKGDNSHS